MNPLDLIHKYQQSCDYYYKEMNRLISEAENKINPTTKNNKMNKTAIFPDTEEIECENPDAMFQARTHIRLKHNGIWYKVPIRVFSSPRPESMEDKERQALALAKAVAHHFLFFNAFGFDPTKHNYVEDLDQTDEAQRLQNDHPGLMPQDATTQNQQSNER